MASSYIPARDADLDTWLNNFKTKIVASPTSYGLVASDGTAINTAYTNWHTAYLAASDPATRTKVTVQTKNQQKSVVLGVVRGYAATIRANIAVSDALKTGLGLHVRDTQPTPVPPPSTLPVLSVTAPSVGVQDVRATNEGSTGSRAKPVGAIGLLLYRAIDTAPVGDPTAATFLSFTGRPSVQTSFTSADNGKTATYFARWTNVRGEVGPWSSPVSMPIAA